jgi:hypothetical protein
MFRLKARSACAQLITNRRCWHQITQSRCQPNGSSLCWQTRVTPMCLDIWHLTADIWPSQSSSASHRHFGGAVPIRILIKATTTWTKFYVVFHGPLNAKTESKIWPRKFLPEHLQLTNTLYRPPFSSNNCANVATKPTVGNKTTNCEKWPLGRSRCRWGG